MKEFENKCGSCANFERLEVDGKLKERGRCCVRGVYVYHQQSQKACLRYKQDRGRVSGSCIHKDN